MNENSRLEVRTIRGLSTAWLENGFKGKPIVFLLHGFPDTPRIWDLQAEALESEYHVIRPFNRGVSESESAEDVRRYGVDAHCLDFLEILKEIDPAGQRQVSVIGHDLGAVLAWNLAQLLGPNLSRLIIFNGLSLTQMWRRFFSARQQLRSWYIYLMQMPFLPEVICGRLPKTLSAFAYQVGGLKFESRPKETEGRAQYGTSFNMYRGFARTTLRTTTLPIHCPTLVLWGDSDPFLEVPRIEELEREAEKVSVRILEGGHWIFREKSDEVNTLLSSFLQEKTGESTRAIGV